MKKIASALLITLLASSYAMAATEISANEAKEKNLILVDTVNHTDRTVTQCAELVSKEADSKGAKFYVIKEVIPIGKGSDVSIKADIYK
ncbi:YdgH/BhsA/McbA-like domain containing protein [Providencia burhodogranariea]|uniref:YdgH/BhsA/McbA-like domain-containing protein n=1 Tax=Providencia burhodogranariea DSM 19968 TaxID=1141662 RepID=K8X1K4_9GAMM|nr:YdgH/BhsA/McbA-like domain containing protein [Providencia burhodogranariea]EKT63532.1 hypothetical protein OOA_04127 [Providencia burhodogranariea DSM 19968]